MNTTANSKKQRSTKPNQANSSLKKISSICRTRAKASRQHNLTLNPFYDLTTSRYDSPSLLPLRLWGRGIQGEWCCPISFLWIETVFHGKMFSWMSDSSPQPSKEHQYPTWELVRRLLGLAWQFRGDCLL